MASDSCGKTGYHASPTVPRYACQMYQIRNDMKHFSSTAVYPRTYNPSFAVGACILAILFASIFMLIFPLIAPAVVVLLLLSLVGKFTDA
jgi:hypothetical protein